MTAVPAAAPISRTSGRLRWLVLALCALGGLLLVEGVTRWLLFGEGERAREYGHEYRQPGLFADAQLEDSYWLLMRKLTPEGRIERFPPFDPLVGWVNADIAAGSYDHRRAAHVRGRRPLLLYGASYAQGLGAGELDGEALSPEFGFLNYGVGGYGADQAYLLLRETLDRYVPHDPVVLIGLVADSDFDRCILRFRSLPKPRLVSKDGALEPEGPVLSGGPDAYLKQHGTGISSYAWSYVLRSSGLLPESWRLRLSGRARLRGEQDELVEAIVLAIRDDCERRGLEYEFVLFSAPDSLPPHDVSTRERMLVSLFEAQRIPYLSVREEMLRAAQELGVEPDAFFVPEGLRKNHPNELGNRVILSALQERLPSFTGGSGARPR